MTKAADISSQRQSLCVLGIETSCDETAVAVVTLEGAGNGKIRSNIVRSQWDAHQEFGGVVPEIAARAHIACIRQITCQALCEAAIKFDDLDAVAVTAGPGLVGGLLIGTTFAAALARTIAKPLIPINHLEGHALTVGLTDALAPPYLLLLVSGGHTQTLLVRDIDRYQRIGTTIDDALGEAFDKTAKILGLGFPGGPAVETAAKMGRPDRFALPRPLIGRNEPHFSFAGLKTAVRRQAHKLVPLREEDIADLTSSFQAAVCDAVSDRCRLAYHLCQGTDISAPLPIVIAGGVAANQTLRAALGNLADDLGTRLVYPPMQLCADNGAMIAWAGAQRLARGLIDKDNVDNVTAPVRPRWPLDNEAQPVVGSGKHGPKA